MPDEAGCDYERSFSQMAKQIPARLFALAAGETVSGFDYSQDILEAAASGFELP